MEKKDNCFLRFFRVFVSAALAGMCVGLGGFVYLSVENKILGAFLFAVGLFTICTFRLHLFTGKVCYMFFNGWEYVFQIPVIWLGNLLGTFITAQAALLTRGGAAMAQKASVLCSAKLSDDFLSLFILGFFCNILIYIAVDGFQKNPHELGKYMSLIFGVVVFILCGTEHSVADMFYFAMGRVWGPETLRCLFVVTMGNACGGIFMPLMRKLAGNA